MASDPDTSAPSDHPEQSDAAARVERRTVNTQSHDHIHTGNINNSIGVAIGHGASVQIYGNIHYYPIILQAPLRNVFTPLIEDRTRIFGGRSAVFTRIAQAIQQDQGSVLVITAPAGFGKTALLATLISQTPAAFAYHFFTPLYGDSSLSEVFFLRNVVEQMAQWHGHTEQIPLDPNELRALYQGFFDKPLNHLRLLVLDGLDEVQTWSLAPYLSRRLPDGLHLILSVRDVGQDWLRDYQLPIDQVTHLPLDGLMLDEVAEVLRTVGHNGVALAEDPARLVQILQAAAYKNDPTLGGDPFYVRLLAEDVGTGLITAATVGQPPQGLEGYLNRWWQIIRQQAGDQTVRDLFGTLTAALGPINRTDLETINPNLVDDWDVGYFDIVLSQVRRFVVGSAEQGYMLAHPRLRTYLSSCIKTKPYCEKLLAYCAQWKHHQSRYALAYYADHLYIESNYETLFALARDKVFYQTLIDTFPEDPDLVVKTARLALEGAIVMDEAILMAEFLILHAQHITSIFQKKSPLEVYRKEGLVQAIQVIKTYEFESGTQWSLVLVGELLKAEEDDQALEIMEWLLEREINHWSNWEGQNSTFMVMQRLGISPDLFVNFLKHVLSANRHDLSNVFLQLIRGFRDLEQVIQDVGSDWNRIALTQAIEQAGKGFGSEAIRTSDTLVSNRSQYLPVIAEALVNAGDIPNFRRLLIPCAQYLDASYKMCKLLEQAYPDQAQAIARLSELNEN